MARISRFQLDDGTLDKLFNLFFTVVGKKNSFSEFKDIITDILSFTERVMIAKRIAIIYLLIKNIDHMSISETLKVSPSTVAKFHLIMEKSTGVVPIFKRLIKTEKIGEFLEEIYLTLRGPGTAGVNWSSAWQQKNKLEKRKKIGL